MYYICQSTNQTEVSREFVSFFFSLVFLLGITMPTISYFCDSNNDIIVLLEVTEEENKESEIAKDAEVKFLEITKLNAALVDSKTSKKDNYYLNLYSLSHGDVISPPPEFV